MDESNFDSSTHLQAATSWLSAYENGEENVTLAISQFSS